MKHIDTFNSFLNEAKGVTYDFTEEYAKKNGIKYTSIVNRWNNLDQRWKNSCKIEVFCKVGRL